VNLVTHSADVRRQEQLPLLTGSLHVDRRRRPDHKHAFTVPGCLDAIADARRCTRDLLRLWGLGEEICDLAVLVISELVTNAVRHTASTAIMCQVRSTDRLVHVEVKDEGAGSSTPRKLAPDADAESGRGLLLVDTLTDAWGVRSSDPDGGRTVWATFRSMACGQDTWSGM
jgi:anti-sigma regulatory factor (Ser/Thr protein kinase)